MTTDGHILGLGRIYTEAAMTKRLIDLDDELLASAQEFLGTSGITDTVRAALQYAAEAQTRAEHLEWLRDGGMEELASAEERAKVWR